MAMNIAYLLMLISVLVALLSSSHPSFASLIARASVLQANLSICLMLNGVKGIAQINYFHVYLLLYRI